MGEQLSRCWTLVVEFEEEGYEASKCVLVVERAERDVRPLRRKRLSGDRSPAMHFTRSCPESYSLLLEAYEARQVITDSICSSLVAVPTVARTAGDEEREERESGMGAEFCTNVRSTVSLITVLFY